MSSPIVEDSSDLNSTTRRNTNREQWSEEQRAFVVHHKNLGAPVYTVARLLNAQFGTFRSESSITNVMTRVHNEEGEESHLLEVANRYSWTKTTDEDRNALNRSTNGNFLYTDEQRSFSMYFFARGLPTKHIVNLFNAEFSANVSLSSLEKVLWRTRGKQNEREEILKAAEKYPWYTDPIPEDHRPLTPTRYETHVRLDGTNDSTATSPDNHLPQSTDWTKEQKAFVLHHSYRGMKSDVLLECLNRMFHVDRTRSGLGVVLNYIWKDDDLVAHLRQHAEQYAWYTPEAAPGTPQSKKTERAQRMREARKRISVKKESYKKVPKDGDFSKFGITEGTDHVRRSLLDSGSYSSRPIKIEDSDNDDVSDIRSFRPNNQSRSDIGYKHEDDLLSASPLSLKTTNSRTANIKSEFRDNPFQNIKSEFRPSPFQNIKSEFRDNPSNTRHPSDLPTKSPFSTHPPPSSNNPSPHLNTAFNSPSPSNLSAYRRPPHTHLPPQTQLPNPAPFPLSSPHSRGHDILHDWAPLSSRFRSPSPSSFPANANANRRQGRLSKRSQSPVKGERFAFSHEADEDEDEDDERGFLRPERERERGRESEGLATTAAAAGRRYREPLVRYEEDRQ